MSNEEKILSLLESMDGRLVRLEAGQKDIRKDISTMKVELKAGVWDEINRLYKRMEEVERLVALR